MPSFNFFLTLFYDEMWVERAGVEKMGGDFRVLNLSICVTLFNFFEREGGRLQVFR